MAFVVENIDEVKEFLDRREWISAECLMKKSKRHRKYLHFQMEVILLWKVKIR